MMKDIKQFINESNYDSINEQNEVDVSDAARTAVNNFTDKSVENFIDSLIFGVEDALKSFKPKKEYNYVTPELINKYKDEWKDFIEYLKKYKN